MHEVVTCQPMIGRMAGQVGRPKTDTITTELRRQVPKLSRCTAGRGTISATDQYRQFVVCDVITSLPRVETSNKPTVAADFESLYLPASLVFLLYAMLYLLANKPVKLNIHSNPGLYLATKNPDLISAFEFLIPQKTAVTSRLIKIAYVP